MLVQTELLSWAGHGEHMGIIQASKDKHLPLGWAPEPSLRLLLCPKPTHILHLAALSLHPSFLYPREIKENDCPSLR